MAQDLFGNNHRNPNKQKRRDPDAITIPWSLKPLERRMLKFNEPGPSGELGGYAKFENQLQEMMEKHPETIVSKRYRIDIDKDTGWRLLRYIYLHEDGGPNDRIRMAFRRFIGGGR